MQLEFRNRQLRVAYESPREAVRLWGVDPARRYGDRLDLIRHVQNWTELFDFRTARLHPLHGEREGQFSMVLIGRWRLILSVVDNTVTVEEVNRHYDD